MYIENNITKKQLSTWLVSMLILIAMMIIIGGLTRLTDSGLSITKWELFSGTLPPLNEKMWLKYFEEYKLIPEFKIQNYSMSLNDFKFIFWWEWGHRILGRLIGISFLIPLIYFTLKIGFKKLINLYFIFILICVQGFIGWYMVSSGLIDKVDVSHFRLSLHLLIAFFIFSLIFWNFLNLNIKSNNETKLNFLIPCGLLTLMYFQIIIGGFVSGMDAGLIYNSWPLMGNSYFPDDNKIINLFSLNAFSDASLVQFLHRKLAYLILLFYIFILFKIYSNKLKNSYTAIKIVGIFLLIQIILGILTLINGAQIFIASMHQISSIFLISATIYLLYINKRTN